MPRAVARPRHRRDDHPVLAATDPRRVSLQHRLHRAQIQGPPPALPLIIARTAPQARPAAPPLPPHRTHMRDQHALFLVELDPLDRGLLDPKQPSPYPPIAHAVPRP